MWGTAGRELEERRDEIHPDRIYAAKLRKPDAKSSQLWFFDAGLMPAVERDRGRTLARLVEDTITELRDSLGARLDTRSAQEDVYRTVFWLLAAKILNDKRVPGFIRVDLTDVDQVFDRIGKHHGETHRFPPFGKSGRNAIDEAARRIATCGSLADVSSESLVFVYENALIDKSVGRGRRRGNNSSYDIRRDLGIHSTPSIVIHHILSQLWPLIESIPVDDRHVLEPACGHAPFLTAALRWLRDWGSAGAGRTTHDYLRSHLHGIEADAFSQEVARLSLTIADEPHGNSWNIKPVDMFEPDELQREARRARILLANPPYEPFTPAQRHRYARLGQPVAAQTKAVELLNRTLPHLPPGAVFGLVVPQGVLYQSEAEDVRRLLASEFEFSEIALFSDNLFEKADAETAVLLGRRNRPLRGVTSLRYRRVREHAMEQFKSRLAFSSEQIVPQDRFARAPGADLRVPELDAVWSLLETFPELSSIASVGQGLIYQGQELPGGEWTVEPFRRGRGVAGFATMPKDLRIYGLPERSSLNLSARAIRRAVAGTTTGVPQVLVNYHPVSRGPWRLKPVIDRAGHAVTSSFLAIRPVSEEIPLEFVWSILVSPVANAFAYCMLQKRNVLAGKMRALPIPAVTAADITLVVAAAATYRELASASDRFMSPSSSDEAVRAALLRLDAEVLRLYNLPPRMERDLLDLFRGAERKGVGCNFGDYFPPDFRPYVPLHEYISEAYRRSMAGEILRHLQPIRSEAALAALDIAEGLAAGD